MKEQRSGKRRLEAVPASLQGSFSLSLSIFNYQKFIAIAALVTLFFGCASLGSMSSGKGSVDEASQTPAGSSAGSSAESSSQNNDSRVENPRPALERTKTDAERVAEAIQLGNCVFLYDYTQQEGADKQLVSQANNAIKRYTGLDGGTGKYRTNKMEAAVRRVPKELMEQVFVDPETALPGIVSSLSKGVSDQFLKAKILHDWICDNIAYDADMYFSGRIASQDYVSVLKKKKAVCSGYTNLFNQMCDLAGIESIGINGYSKGFGYTGKIGRDTDHAWNAVHIGNKWYLVDVTWDAGTVERRTFIKQYSTEWLFLDSRPFLYSHLPEEDEYQYYVPVLSSDDFMREANIPGKFFQYGLALKTEDLEYTNLIDGSFTFDLLMRNSNVLLSSVLRTPEQRDIGGAAWAERKRAAVTFDFDVPDTAEYKGHVFARFNNEERPQWRVAIQTFEGDWLPRVEALFNTEDPKDRNITEKERDYFSASYYKVEDNKAYYFLEDQFDAPRNSAVMKIHKLLGLSTSSMDNVLSFTIKAAPGYTGFGKGILKYPFTYSTYNNVSNTQLVSPVKGVLKSGETERFAVSTKDFTRVAIIIDDEFTQLVKNNKTGNFELDFKTPDGIAELPLYASKDGRQYTGLIQYSVVP